MTSAPGSPGSVDLLRQGSQWLEQMRTAHCTSPVEYRRPPDTFTVQATFGRTSYEVADELSGGGLTVGAHMWDFLVLAESLAGRLPGAGEPEPGDVIVADGRRYEVMALGEDTKGWRWSDPYRTTYRIHTRDIGPSDDG